MAAVVQYDYTPIGMMGYSYVGLGADDPPFLTPTPLVEAYGMDTFTSDIVGNYAYTSEGIWDLVTLTRVNDSFPDSYGTSVFGATGSTLWGGSAGHLVSFDGSDPTAPVRHGSYFPVHGGGYARAIFASCDDLAYFAHGDTVIATRVEVPQEPTVVQRLVTGLGCVRHLAIQGRRLFVSQDHGLAVADVDADGGLTVRGHMDLSGDDVGVIAPDGPVVYAVPHTIGRLRVIDVTDPSMPTLIGEPDISGGDLVLHGDLLYVVNGGVEAVRRQCTGNVAVTLTGQHCAWQDGAAVLTWNMDADLAAVRVTARTGARTWVVPWRREEGRCRAVDAHAPRGRTVFYEIQMLTDGQWRTMSELSLAIPAAALALAAPSPNPFNAGTVLSFSVDDDGPVELSVLDAAGRRVRTLVRDERRAGDHTVTWRGDDDRGRPVAAGTYFVRLVAPRGERMVKATLVK